MVNTDIRVSPGGIFHTRKVQYCKETHAILKQLLDESKLSITQRNSIWNSMKKGESLPGPQKQENFQDLIKKGEILIAPSFPRKRSFDTIKQSGAYEREQFYPACNKVLTEKEKERLQNLMAYGQCVEPASSKITQKERQNCYEEKLPEDEIFDHLLIEIKERQDFLKDMEALGEAKKYQAVIQQEIAAKIRQMKAINHKKCEELGL